MISHIIKNKKNYFSILAIVIMCFTFLYYFLGLSNMDINVPLFYNGDDSFMGLSNTKILKDGSSLFESKYLGAPFGANRYDYLSMSMYNFDNIITKILLEITGSVGITFNIQYLLLFPFISITSFFVMRQIKLKYIICVIGSVTFAFLPYIFLRNQAHLVLSQYQFVPFSILICLWLYNEDVFVLNKKFFQNKKNLISIILLLLISNNGISYYPFFTCYLIIITGISKTIKKGKLDGLKQSFGMVGLVLACFIINLIPNIIYILNNGQNLAVAQRSKIEAEVYGLKITQLFIPNKPMNIPKLDNLINYYANNAPLPNEGSEHLGIIGIIGFVILIIALLIKNKENNYIANVKLLSELNIFAILLGTIGGFGSIFSLIISSSIRGYNRISIFIAYICILAFCIILNELINVKFKPLILYVFTVIIFLFSIYEQYPNVKPNYKYAVETFYSDKKFVENIEGQVPKNSMIFQLPYHKYPESGPLHNMNDYHLFAGFIHSDELRWSYGGMKERESDLWNRKVSAFNTINMVKTISLAGFEGIYIDKKGYDEQKYNELEKELIDILNVTPIYSDNNQLSFFNMVSYNEGYRGLYSSNELNRIKEEILNMNTFELGTGFTVIEGEAPNQWMWLSKQSNLIFNNLTNKDKKFNLKFDISTTSTDKSSLILTENGIKETYEIDINGISINKDIILKPGKNYIYFETDAPRVYAPEDPRELYLRITNFDFDERLNLK